MIKRDLFWIITGAMVAAMCTTIGIIKLLVFFKL
jgi:hypothetical protein